MVAQTSTYIWVHPAGYLHLGAVSKAYGQPLAEALATICEEVSEDGSTVSYGALEDRIDEECKDESVPAETRDFLKRILEELSQSGADGDIFFFWK